MKGASTSSLYNYFQGGLGKKHGDEDGHGESAEAGKQLQSENTRSFCPICDSMAERRAEKEMEEEEEKEIKIRMADVAKVEEEIKGSEEEKAVVNAEAADHGQTGGGTGNGSDGWEENDQMELVREFFGECDLSAGWEEWKYENDEMWDEWMSYPRYWDAENAALYYWDAMENNNKVAEEEEWVEHLWAFDDHPPNPKDNGPNPTGPEA